MGKKAKEARKRRRAAARAGIIESPAKKQCTARASDTSVRHQSLQVFPERRGRRRKKRGRKAGQTQLISKFHTIQKIMAQLPTMKEYKNDPVALMEKKKSLNLELEKLGGIEAYQRASILGESSQSEFESSSWVLSEISNRYSNLVDDTKLSANEKISLLDVGAIVNHYPETFSKWSKKQTEIRNKLVVTSIDLNAQDDVVIQTDFFDFAQKCLASSPPRRFHCIVLSLVVNFVGSAAKRGEMLRLASSLLRPYGLLFLVLPSACIQNSRYMKYSKIVKILRSIGLPPAEMRANPNPSGIRKEETESTNNSTNFSSKTKFQHRVQLAKKLFFVVCRRSDLPEDGYMTYRPFKRKLCRGGIHRNNFSITL